ncbi:hypothetical protein PR202_gb19161 [Eleusine coracana subsp. coracana]|uniref:FAS1 domain-containing protein n=1 Tax=Eleusine coracana subsp. coracana TaxID=191504 RepID=A0AAV5F5A0_ELECO|nr:hypothetical protein QOZ80_3BG0287770 [Eleusine coracana subsp. coracana]GJN30824.1 hypothetical protein PR202_gb19161 [Eleusine coracana subsp. coracana]
MAATARRRRSLFPLRPRPLPPQRLLLAATAAVCTLLFLLVVLFSTSPSSPPTHHHAAATRSSPSPPHYCAGAAAELGELGDVMVSMLPNDLPFTIFAPSASAFRRVLNLRPRNGTAAVEINQTAADDGDANTYAVLSRVLGFSAVPWRLFAADVPPPPPLPRGESEIESAGAGVMVESVSGLRIHVARRDDGAAAGLVANGVRSECVDVVRGETVVHVMAGVLMDAEFERSFAAGFN